MFIKKKANKNKINIQLKKPILFQKRDTVMAEGEIKGVPFLLITSPFLDGKNK